MTDTTQSIEVTDAARKPKTVEIKVNKKTVTMPKGDATGLQIKQAAIAQGVRIELDFQLAEIDSHPHQIIGDTDVVKIHEGLKFTATAADDNS